MNIVITGGAGFIGTALARQLNKEGHKLVLLDLKHSDVFRSNSYIVDITDRDALIQACKGADVIYNLAAEHRDDVSPAQKYYDVNVEGAKNVIAAAEANNIDKIIFTSTVAVYPLVPADPENGSAEHNEPAPFNDYGHSKLQAEAVFKSWVGADPKRSLATMRLVATFGPGNRGNIFTLMNQIARGKFIMIGDGANRKSIAYLENVAAFLKHLLKTDAGDHLYNYADKPDLKTGELVQTIRKALGKEGFGPKLPYTLGIAGGKVFDVAAKITGRTFPISSIRVQKFCANTIVNADKLKETGFKAPHSLEDGLNEMIAAEFPSAKKAA